MKTTLLKTAILAAAGATALSANAYDDDGLRTGNSGVELHYLGFDIARFSSGTAVDVENQLVMKIHNKTGDFAPGVNSPVADDYRNPAVLDASGNVVYEGDPLADGTDADPTVVIGFTPVFDSSGNVIGLTPITETQPRVSLGLAFSYAPNALGANVPFTFENGTGDVPTQYHLETAVEGKLQPNSYWRTITVTSSGKQTTFFDIGKRGFVNFLNCATDPNYHDPAVQATIDGIMDGPDTPVTTDPFPGTSCVLSGIGTLKYFTCDTGDECGQFAKAVPVPAFAAATLALGLAGITYTSSRRRSIK